MGLQKQVVLNTFKEFWDIWAKREKGAFTIEDIQPFFAEDVSAIGSGEHELGKSLQDVVRNFSDDFSELQTPLLIDFFYESVKLLSETVSLVEAEAYVDLEVESGARLKFHLRFTTLFVLKGDKWLISHNHVSIPSSEQEEGEAYPIDALKAKNNRLEKLVTQRTQQLNEKTQLLEEERDRTESLLFNILPKKIAKEIMLTGKNNPTRHEAVSVIFTDLKEFTKIAATISARKLVEELNDLFFHFDDFIRTGGLEKIKTIGDSYMAVCGLPEPDNRHAYKCVETARKMLAFIEERNAANPINWSMRIGVHSGPVVAGVVGNHKFTYDLWGNTVNLASRLEGAGEGGKINISEQTYLLIKNEVECEYRGKRNIKGDQQIDMYFVK